MNFKEPIYKLQLSNIPNQDEENIDDSEDEDNDYCSCCGVKLNSIYTVYLKKEEKKTSACYMCRIVANFDKCHNEELIVCKTKLEQVEIIRKTFEFFKKNKTIPYINEIDENAKKIAISAKDFCNIIENKKYKKKLKNIAVFMSSHVGLVLNKNNNNNMFGGSKINIKKYNNEYYDLPEYELNKKEKKIIDKYYSKLEDKKSEAINHTKIKIDKKIDTTKEIINMKNKFKSLYL